MKTILFTLRCVFGLFFCMLKIFDLKLKGMLFMSV